MRIVGINEWLHRNDPVSPTVAVMSPGGESEAPETSALGAPPSSPTLSPNFSGFKGSSSSSSSGSSSHSALPTWATEDAQNLLGQLSGMVPQYGQSMNRLLGLPEEIDDWTNERMKHMRVRGDDITNTMNQVANQRASKGIMGGTEANNLRAGLLYMLMRGVQEEQQTAMGEGNQLKSAAIIGAPSAAATPIEQINNLLSASKETSGTSGSSSHSSDDSGIARVMADLIQMGYTG